MKIRFSDMPMNQPIKVVFNGLEDARTRKIMTSEFIYLKAFFDFDQKGTRDFELCMPYYKFIFAVRQLPIKKQRWIRDKLTEMRITKLDKGYMSIDDVAPYKRKK